MQLFERIINESFVSPLALVLVYFHCYLVGFEHQTQTIPLFEDESQHLQGQSPLMTTNMDFSHQVERKMLLQIKFKRSVTLRNGLLGCWR